jgi:hypothetical protein
VTAAATVPALRGYQAEVASAIAKSVRREQGLSFSVQMARQSGKNETSARLEMFLMAWYAARGVYRSGVKCAPTQTPQAELSRERLLQKFAERGLAAAADEDGHVVRFGTASYAFLSAEPESNVVGHTANLMLEVDEAQDVDPEKFDKDFRPMAASTAATIVYWGTPWDDFSLLERAKQHHLELERRDGIKRHFEVSWERVAGESEPYRRYVEAERERLGAEHPLFLTQYCMRTLPGQGRLLSATDLALLQGVHARQDGAERDGGPRCDGADDRAGADDAWRRR